MAGVAHSMQHCSLTRRCPPVVAASGLLAAPQLQQMPSAARSAAQIHTSATFGRHALLARSRSAGGLVRAPTRICADSAQSGSVSHEQLMKVAEKACRASEAVVREAADKEREITFKGATDLVTDTDQKSEQTLLGVLSKEFPDHAVLGEEGGIQGNINSDYLWICDPIDGTTNFTHSYPPFAISVGVLEKGVPVAAAICEFAGSKGNWHTRFYTAYKGGGTFVDGQRVHVTKADNIERSLLITGFDQVEHGEPWHKNMELFKHFTDISQGVRRSGAAAIDMAHVAAGIADAYWELRIKPWDVAAGTLLITEAGGTITTMDGNEHSVFSRSHLATNGKLHEKMLPTTKAAIEELISNGNDFSPWFIPDGVKFHIPGRK